MKKTLFLLASVALATSVQAATLFTTGFQGTALTGSATDSLDKPSLTLSTSGIKSSNLAANLLVPDTQMSGNANGWTVTFTFTAIQAIDITDLTLGFQFVTAGGERHGNSDPKQGTATITLSCNGVDYTTGSWAFERPAADKNNGGSTPTADVQTMAFTTSTRIEAGETFTLTVNPVASDYGGTFLGLSTLSLGGTVAPVPEPATASLSLLGLAALMMRRRRA